MSYVERSTGFRPPQPVCNCPTPDTEKRDRQLPSTAERAHAIPVTPDRATDPASACLATRSANRARCDLAGGQEMSCTMLRAHDESAFRSLLSDIGPCRVSAVDLDPQHRAKSRDRLCGCKINPHSPPAGIEISCTRFLEFSTFFGRGLQVEKGVRNEGKYMKTWEVEI